MNGREINYQKRRLMGVGQCGGDRGDHGCRPICSMVCLDVHRIAQDESDRQFRANLLHIKAKQSVDENTEVVSTQK